MRHFIRVLQCFVCTMAFVPYSSLATAQDDADSLNELIRQFTERSEQFHDKEMRVEGKILEKQMVPVDYMGAENTGPQKWRFENRVGKFKLKFDGHRCIEICDSDKSNWAFGYDGERRVSISRLSGHPRNASINCRLTESDLADMPSPEYGQGLKLAYFNVLGKADRPMFSYVIGHLSATTEVRKTAFGGQDALAVLVRNLDEKTTCFFPASCEPLLIGWEWEIDDLLVRIKIDYKGDVPETVTKTVLGVDAAGEFTSLVGYAEADVTKFELTDKSASSEYLPAIPKGTKVKDNCASTTALEPAESEDNEGAAVFWPYWVAIGVVVVLPFTVWIVRRR